ncbi:tyrosine recombinase XerC [Trueperella sp. LYQ143]|uniref:site-specific integrase n=1 Tax=Trueperella sp. LYQ143 TaxID=3391059 RepID=UPI0039830316
MKNTRSTMRTLLASAVEEGLIDRNPFPHKRLLNVPRRMEGRRRRNPRALTRDEFHALTAYTPEYYRLMVELTGTVGLRSGEVRALLGRDVLILSGEVWLNVDKSVYKGGRNAIVTTPKTETSIRRVYIPRVNDLPARLVRLATRNGLNGLLFPGKNGDYMGSSVFQMVVNQAGYVAGIGHVSPHDLRHTAATIALRAGVHPRDVQEMLGHQSGAMTNHYTHSGVDYLRESGRLLAEYYEQANQSPAYTDEAGRVVPAVVQWGTIRPA